MYLSWDNIHLESSSEKEIEKMYNMGYVFTRLGKGVMVQTRSLRIDLSKFELSSENKRILRKMEGVITEAHKLPYKDYNWKIHKLGAHFYTTKFGNNIFSANKIKEIMTDKDKSNFNIVFVFKESGEEIGYCIAHETKNTLHYSYPFYSLGKESSKDLGMGMMTEAILYAKNKKKKYIYLGSASRPADKYKLQFAGLEYFDSKKWSTDMNALKKVLSAS